MAAKLRARARRTGLQARKFVGEAYASRSANWALRSSQTMHGAPEAARRLRALFVDTLVPIGDQLAPTGARTSSSNRTAILMTNTHRATSVFAALLVSLGVTGVATVLRPTTQTQPTLDGFRYQGEPIHPKLVEEFESWISDDRPPTTVVVDVAAAFGANEYSEAVQLSERGLVRYESAEGWYGYEHLGQMKDGTHVLRTASSGGGSGVFQNLLFAQLSKDEARTPEGKRHGRVLMEVVGRFVLGDRDNGAIEILGDRVVVGASRYRAFATTLDFGR